MKRPLRSTTRPLRPVTIVQRISGGMSVSLAGVALDDLDPRGTWGAPKSRLPGRNVTADLCGDPAPSRSALDQMRGVRP